MKEFLIDDTKVTLENKGGGKGEVTITCPKRGIFSVFFGAMGNDLSDFLLRINSDYFCDKLLPHGTKNEFCPKRTFANIRKAIKEDINLPWYEYMDFQKSLRDNLREFQRDCQELPHSKYFVDCFKFRVIDCAKFYLIDDKYERQWLQEDFNNWFSEPWYLIGEKKSEIYLWMEKLFKKINKRLQKEVASL